MNLRDLFVHVLMTPAARLSIRGDVHGLTLAQAADRALVLREQCDAK